MATTATTFFPGLTLEIAPGTGMKTAAVSWTDITADLRGFSISRGRERELDQFQAGSATFRLNNRARKYDPEYSAGSFFGNLVPMMQIQLRATYNAVTKFLFYGYVEAWPQDYPGFDADSIVEVTAVDGFSVLTAAPLPDSVWDIVAASYAQNTATYPNSAWYSLGEKYGQVMGDRSGNGFHGTYGTPIVSTQQGILPYSGSGQALEFDGVDDVGIATVPKKAAQFTVMFWARMPNPMPTSGYTTVIRSDVGQFTSSCDAYTIRLEPTGYMTADIEGMATNPRWSNLPMRAGRTYFVCLSYGLVATPGALYIDGVLQSTSGSGNANWLNTATGQTRIGGLNGLGTELAWSDIIDEVVILSDDIAAGDVTALYNAGAVPWDSDTSGGRFTHILDAIGWPASLRDLDAGESILGSATLGGSALDYLQLVGQTEAGLFYMTADGKVRLVGRGNMLTEAAFSTSDATYGDSGAELKYHGITIDGASIQQVNNIGRVSRQGGITQEYEDTTSSTKYGPRSIEQSGLLMRTDGEAHDLAMSLVFRRKDPGFRVDQLTISPRRDPATLFPKVLAYELGQKITTVRRPQGVGSAVTKEVYIEGIRHEVDAPSKTWVTTWATAPVDPNEDNWAIVDTSLVGTGLVAY